MPVAQPCLQPIIPLPSAPGSTFLLPPAVLQEPVTTLTPPLAPFARLNNVAQLPASDPLTLYFLATLCRASYAPGPGPFMQAARAAFGSAASNTIFVPNSSATVPGYGIIVTPGGDAIVVVSGTTNLAQWLAQTLQSSLEPTNFDATDTAQAMSVYLAAAATIYARMAAITPQPNSWLFTGHSMGGAVAAVLAYHKYRDQLVANKLITFAAPKAGDAELSFGFPTSNQNTARLVIGGDVIPALPPEITLALKPILLTAPAPIQAAFQYWDNFAPVNQSLQYLAANGTLEYGDEPNLVQAVIACIIAAATGNGLPIVAAHMMSAFCNSLANTGGNDNARALATGWAQPSNLANVNANLQAGGL